MYIMFHMFCNSTLSARGGWTDVSGGEKRGVVDGIPAQHRQHFCFFCPGCFVFACLHVVVSIYKPHFCVFLVLQRRRC